MTEGWAVGWVKERNHILPAESSCCSVLRPSDVFFPWCWFGTPHFPVVAHVGVFLTQFRALPTCCPTGNVICYFCTLWGGIIPAELIATRPHNLRFFGFTRAMRTYRVLVYIFWIRATRSTCWSCCLSHCTTSWNVAGSYPDGVIWFSLS